MFFQSLPSVEKKITKHGRGAEKCPVATPYSPVEWPASLLLEVIKRQVLIYVEDK